MNTNEYFRATFSLRGGDDGVLSHLDESGQSVLSDKIEEGLCANLLRLEAHTSYLEKGLESAWHNSTTGGGRPRRNPGR